MEGHEQTSVHEGNLKHFSHRGEEVHGGLKLYFGSRSLGDIAYSDPC